MQLFQMAKILLTLNNAVENVSCDSGKDVTMFREGTILSIHQAKQTTKDIC